MFKFKLAVTTETRRLRVSVNEIDDESSPGRGFRLHKKMLANIGVENP